MHINKVIPAFVMLLEELDAIIPELNQQGARLMAEQKYDEARQVIAKAEAVLAFQAKVQSLKEELVQMAVPPTKSRGKKKKSVKRKMTTLLDQGLRSPNEAFLLPILQTLVKLGGSAQSRVVVEHVEKMMKEELNEYDYQTLPSNPNVVRWENNAHWARLKLVQQGYLSSDSPRGVWEITQEGRKWMKENSNNSKSIAEDGKSYQKTQGASDFSKVKIVFEPGKIYHRQKDLHDKFGGNPQSGIAPCAEAPIVFLFTSPIGDEYGYEDGWVSEDIYHYFGEGQSGDMEMTRGNRAIRDHLKDGRDLHLFKKVDTGRYGYMGQFRYLKHEIVEGLDAEQKQREMIKFELEKVDNP